MLDAHYPDRMLLAEANQWPEDVRAYFGDGDECHMAFHFPLMPRMFMAIAEEDRYPILDIMRQTPEIPDDCQWAIFLRNHDELTLEMVTRARTRISCTACTRAIRAHDQHRHPAPPRAADGKRPPQHRTDDQPAALDAGHADRLLRRRNRDGRQHLSRRPRRRAHADAMVGRSQRRLFARRPGNGSFCRRSWTRSTARVDQRRSAGTQSLVALALDAQASSACAKASRAFGRGTITFLHPAIATDRLRARVRRRSRAVRCQPRAHGRKPVALDLSRFNGRIPVEMIGWSAFPAIGDDRYVFTLHGHGSSGFCFRRRPLHRLGMRRRRAYPNWRRS